MYILRFTGSRYANPTLRKWNLHGLRRDSEVMLLGVSGGASLEMIGCLLGHTQIGTTQRYAHLIDAPPARRGQRRGRDAEAAAQGGGGGRNHRCPLERRLIAVQSLPTFAIATGGRYGQHHDSQP